jgi:hypothetical protein
MWVWGESDEHCYGCFASAQSLVDLLYDRAEFRLAMSNMIKHLFEHDMNDILSSMI